VDYAKLLRLLLIISEKEEAPVVIHKRVAQALIKNLFKVMDGLSVLVSLRHVIQFHTESGFCKYIGFLKAEYYK